MVAILVECDLSVQSQGLCVCKTEIEMQEVLRLMFQVVLVTATPFANAFTSSNLWTFPGSVRRSLAADARDVYVLFTAGMLSAAERLRRTRRIEVPPTKC